MKLKKLTKAQIGKLLAKPLPDYNFDYSKDDWAKAYEHREYKSAVTAYNYVLPALKAHLKTGTMSTWNDFGVSIHKVLQVKSYLHEILKGVS